jgi:hypothetical protein
VRLTAIYLIGVLACSLDAQGPKTEVRESHGTVNIIFANDNGLVAVTDKMLTWGKYEENHAPTGTKLFKIDDSTICAMAGAYSSPGIFKELALLIPNVMSEYAHSQQVRGKIMPISFDFKFELLTRVFEHSLTGNLQSRIAFDPALPLEKESDLELTLAGYDLDGTLKIAQVKLSPVKTPSGISYAASPIPLHAYVPSCEVTAGFEERTLIHDDLPRPREPRRTLFCSVVGLPDIAELRLAHPEQFKQLPALQVYATAQTSHQSLSLIQLRDLALELENETAEDERRSGKRRVGGTPQVAVLSGGRVAEAPDPIPADPKIGTGLDAAQIGASSLTCAGGPKGWEEGGWDQGLMGPGPRSLIQTSVTLDHCGQRLDGILFHDSHFLSSNLFYLGFGPLLFPDSNEVTDSSLIFGPDVSLERADVKHLICGYRWKTVLQVAKKVDVTCDPKPLTATGP